MIEFFTLVILLVIYSVIRVLHLASSAEQPTLYYAEKSPFAQKILLACPILSKTYLPCLLWGKSGHLQTIVYAKLGRTKMTTPVGKRYHHRMGDGATFSFDVFEPIKQCQLKKGDYSVLVSPGIANSSESGYIRTFVNYAQHSGYRVAVQNHLGALSSEKLTSSRMFTYGNTEEFGLMVEKMMELYPNTHLLACGFSMGGNIVTKYLGEKTGNQDSFLCGMSICQGYSVERAESLLMEWTHLRRAYIYLMTLHQKTLLNQHHDILLGEPGRFDESKIFAATSLVDLDEYYHRRRAGFPSLKEYYNWCSSSNHIHNISIPMFILNANDDPIVPNQLHDIPRNYAEKSDKCVYAVTKHGGHLGYFEGGLLVPDPVTWLDRAVIEYADAIVRLHRESQL